MININIEKFNAVIEEGYNMEVLIFHDNSRLIKSTSCDINY